jgi:hypothetical protein
MTPDRFDTLLAALARARTRRDMIAAAVAVITAGTTVGESARAVDSAAAVCRGRNEKCKHKRECCSERCRSRKGSKKKRKCDCSPEGERCLDVSDCCEGDVRLFCVSGFCVRER